MTSSKVRRTAALIVGLSPLALALSCGGDDDAVPELRIVAVDPGGPGDAGGASGAAAGGAHGTAGHGGYRFALPDDLPGGLARVRLENRGTEPHHAQLFRLRDGARATDLSAALARGGPPAAASVDEFVGGTGLVAPGRESAADAVVDLEPGNYAFLCLVEGPDGRPHLAQGMLHPFTVGDTNGEAPAPEPSLRAELADYHFDLPERIAGDALVEVVNAGTEPHEMLVARLDGDTPAGQAPHDLEQGLPTVTPIGGMQALLPGAGQLLQLGLEPGRYAVICAVPSPDGVPHHGKGMVREVTVT